MITKDFFKNQNAIVENDFAPTHCITVVNADFTKRMFGIVQPTDKAIAIPKHAAKKKVGITKAKVVNVEPTPPIAPAMEVEQPIKVAEPEQPIKPGAYAHSTRGNVNVEYCRQTENEQGVITWLVYYTNAKGIAFAEYLEDFDTNTKPKPKETKVDAPKLPHHTLAYRRGDMLWIAGTNYPDRTTWIANGFRWSPKYKQWWKKVDAK